MVIALVIAPLQMTFAAGAVSFKHPIACHTDKQGHVGHHTQMEAADVGQMDMDVQMQMMVDCEHFTGMQHGADSSCQAADAQSGAAVFAISDVLAVSAEKTSFSYDTAMVGGTVPLLRKPPRVLL